MYGFLLVFYSNFIPKTHRFWDVRLVSIQWPWKPGWGSLKVIENYTIRLGNRDFLLTFYSSHRPISHRFRDKRRFPSKIARKSPFFPSPVYLTPPLKGFLWNWVSAQGSEETRMIGLSDGRESFKIGLAVDTIPTYDGHPASHVAVASTRYAYLRRAVEILLFQRLWLLHFQMTVVWIQS